MLTLFAFVTLNGVAFASYGRSPDTCKLDRYLDTLRCWGLSQRSFHAHPKIAPCFQVDLNRLVRTISSSRRTALSNIPQIQSPARLEGSAGFLDLSLSTNSAQQVMTSPSETLITQSSHQNIRIRPAWRLRIMEGARRPPSDAFYLDRGRACLQGPHWVQAV